MHALKLANAVLFLSTLSLRRATSAHLEESKSEPISIHALLAESDHGKALRCVETPVFLSTLSLRRATTLICDVIAEITISIHALLAESDRSADCNYRSGHPISIHALLAESDIISPHSTSDNGDFYPRSPCGERPVQIVIIVVDALFLSTLSLRRATAKVHKTVGHFCAYGTNFMGIASSC